MKKLILYSDQVPSTSEKIDNELVTLLGKPDPIIGYIPSCADPQRKYYKERQEYYSRLGMDLKIYFELDEDYHSDLLESLLSCDAIHLSGGNTYYVRIECAKALRLLDSSSVNTADLDRCRKCCKKEIIC